ncbi:hypothetical protein ACRAWF_22630 [Streptomyces sp. L7]
MYWNLLFSTLVTPGLVTLIALVERRAGPTAAGLLQGTPVIAFPVMTFLALTRSEEFFARSALSAFSGLLSLQVTLLMYGVIGRAKSTSVVTVSAIGVWFASAALISVLVAPVAAVLSAVAFWPTWFTTRRLCPGAGFDRQPREPAPLGLPGRAVIAFFVVLAISLLSSSLDAIWIGLLTVFPTSSAILLSFSHATGGKARVRSALGGINTTHPSLGTVLFALLPSAGPIFLTLVTTLVSLMVSLCCVAIVGALLTPWRNGAAVGGGGALTTEPVGASAGVERGSHR